MRKISLLWSRIERYVIIQYLSEKISPHALLATVNGLKLRYKSSHGGVNIYSDSKGNKYVTVPMGFTPVEKYNLAIELREVRLDYDILLEEKKTLEKKINQKDLNIKKLTKEVSELKAQIKSRAMNITIGSSEIKKKDELNVSLN